MASTSSSESLTLHRRPLHALTGIRFLAASYVVLTHTEFANLVYVRSTFGPYVIAANGYLAVTLFFLLSGFILAYTYYGQVESRSDCRRFWEARFARIWPMYAVSLLASSATFRAIPPASEAIPTLLMVQSWNPCNLYLAAAWNSVCWTLSVEAFFYLLFPAIQHQLERCSRRTLHVLLGVVLLVCVLCNTSAQTIGHVHATGIYHYIPFAVVKTPEFVVGVLLGNLYLRQWRSTEAATPRRGLVTWAAAIAIAGLLCLRAGPATSLIVPAFAALLVGLTTEKSLLNRLLSTRWLIVGGQISYSIYLLQIPCKAFVDLWMDECGVREPLLRFAAVFGVLLIVSYLCFRLIEEPARRLIRGMFLHLEQARNAARKPATSNV